MKAFFEIIGQTLETTFFAALTGLAGYLGWLSWNEQSVYLLIAAIAVVGIAGLMLVLITTTSIMGRMVKIERTISKQIDAQTIELEAKPTLSAIPSRPISRVTIPDLGEAMERLNRKKAEDEATSKIMTEKETVKQDTKPSEKVVAEKPIEKPAEKVAEKPIEQPVKKYPFGRKPKEQPKPTVSEVAQAMVHEIVKQETNARIDKIVADNNGNGHIEDATAVASKVCPKCGVKGQMIMFGLREGRQKWHCQSCGKTTVEVQKRVGAGT